MPHVKPHTFGAFIGLPPIEPLQRDVSVLARLRKLLRDRTTAVSKR